MWLSTGGHIHWFIWQRFKLISNDKDISSAKLNKYITNIKDNNLQGDQKNIYRQSSIKNYSKNLINKKSCKIFHQNIQHLKSRIEPLEITLDELNPDIVILTEHDMNASEIERLTINNYIINSFYAREISTKGGVMILS